MAAAPEDVERLRELAAEAGRTLEGAEPTEVLAWAVETFGTGFCISASMSDAVVIDMAARVGPGVDVVFLDTGYHFTETLDTRDRVAKRYDVNVLTILPKQTVREQDAMFGACLHDRDPDACCTLRKVEPLRRSLEPYVAWASGIRRDETENRRDIKVVDWDPNRRMVKVNPLATWNQRQVDEYVIANDVEVNPLVYEGYPSIGCAPCTHKVEAGADPRSGRWAGRSKTECGLHLG